MSEDMNPLTSDRRSYAVRIGHGSTYYADLYLNDKFVTRVVRKSEERCIFAGVMWKWFGKQPATDKCRHISHSWRVMCGKGTTYQSYCAKHNRTCYNFCPADPTKTRSQ